jgi:hypothetical protein
VRRGVGDVGDHVSRELGQHRKSNGRVLLWDGV